MTEDLRRDLGKHDAQIETLDKDQNKDLILYGKDLIAHTSLYFGENGKIFKNNTN